MILIILIIHSIKIKHLQRKGYKILWKLPTIGGFVQLIYINHIMVDIQPILAGYQQVDY
jgi:hypothetical protein